MQLSDIATFVEQSIRSTDISLSDYVTTDSLLQNREGRVVATNLPPSPCNLTLYQPGDILMANIRPYLKKIWMADRMGGCSADVLVFRAKENISSNYLYSVLLQDFFFDYVMLAPKGSKMPRGDKNHIMRFPIFELSNEDADKVGDFIWKIEAKLANNRKQNAILEKMAKQIYDYWFVQFDFPDENGRPYKSSGGKMVWNETLKREIPVGWEVKPIFDELDITYGYPFSTDLFTDVPTNKPLIRIRDILEGTISAYTTEEVSDKYRLQEGDVLVGMDGNFHMNYWHNNTTYLNQRCVRLRPRLDSNITSIQIFYGIQPYIKAKEKTTKGSTVGHLSDKDMKGLFILKADDSTQANERKCELDNLLKKTISNRKEMLQLQSLRSYLLPLLMTGQVKL